MATLYIVGTPIGNLEDITLRALRILKEVDCVVCEDTRVTKKLLAKYGIDTPTMSANAHATPSQLSRIIELLREGKSLALVTDAGTPAISDPGSLVVARVREALGEAVSIVAVPGPSALTAALSISGIPSSEFLFVGFLPHKKGRQTLLQEIADEARTVVLYESPHRILKTLEALSGLCPHRRIAVGRELTKLYEEMREGTPGELIEWLTSATEKQRGEFVVILAPIRK